MRGDVGIGLGVLVGTVLLGAFSLGLLGILVNLIWAFVYNKMYTTKLIDAGYEISDSTETARRAGDALGIQRSKLVQSSSIKDFDGRKWNALLQYDPDIKRIADELARYDQKYVDQFASAFMALNDKNYLPQIVQTILATARADAARSVIGEGVSNNFSWKRYSDGVLEARIDKQWMKVDSIDVLNTLPVSRSV